MKKKFLLVFLLALMASGTVFASSKDKLGAYLGWPIGLSYSHEFTDLVELDLIASYNGFFSGYGGLNIHLGALFTLIDGDVGGNPWALTLGPSVGGSIGFIGGGFGGFGIFVGFSASLDVLADLRWEIDITSVKGFNIFVDVAPGLTVPFKSSYYTTPVWIGYRAGVGLRYRFQ